MIRLTGIVELTGEHGTGKTTAAFECGAEPNKICIYDDDIKGRATVRQLKDQGMEVNYVDATEMRMSCQYPHQYYTKIKQSLAQITPDQFDVVIFDTWTAVQKACREYAKTFPQEFKDEERPGVYFTGNSQMVNGQISRIGRDIEAQLINSLEQKVKLVFVINHLKDHYVNNIQTTKQIPDDSKTLSRVPSMRVWYRHNPQSPVPISLFIKRPSTKRYNAEIERIETVNIFPRKIIPLQSDTSVWDAYNRYIDNPIGTRMPTDDETPTAYELSIIEGTLTPDQKRMYEEGVHLAVVTASPEEQTNEERAKKLKADGMSVVDISKQFGLSVPETLNLLK